MNKKTLLIAVLGIASSVTWAPQVLDRFTDEPNPVDEFPDPPMNAEADGDAFDAPDVAPVPVAVAGEVQPVSVAPAASGDLVDASSEELLRALEVFRGPAARVEFDALAAQAPAWSAPESEPTEPVEAVVAEPEPAMTAAQVDAFLAGRQLTAIVRGENGQWALLDGQIVRPGAELEPGLIAVEAVRARSLELSTPVGPRRLTLPGLAVRVPSVTGGGDAGMAGSAQEAATPAPQVAPAPALPDPDALLEQLETALDTDTLPEAP